MAKNIFKVATESDYATMLNNGLPVPHIVLINETGKYHVSGRFAKKESAMPGDFVCFDNGELVFVKKNGWNEELIETLGAPQAIVVASYGVAEEGKVLCCAIDGLTDTLGTGKPTAGWNREDLIEFSGIMTKSDNILHTTLSSTETGLLPSDIFSAEVCAEDTNVGYSVESGNRARFAMSPYLTNGSVNAEFFRSYPSQESQHEELNVLVKGITNIFAYSNAEDDRTQYLDNSGIGAAVLYATDNIAAGSWFLPSCYHLGLLMAKLGSVNDAFAMLGIKKIPVEGVELMSSQSNGTETLWTVNTETGLAELHEGVRDTTRFDAIAFTLL